jgi:hypothetical protein
VDASKPFRRTPAGDAEVQAPAKGLSVTQRRILTLLDTPGRLRDLPLGPMVNTARLTRDATRLTQAGLVTYEVSDAALVAANAASLASARRSPLGRPLPVMLIACAACALVWVGWRFSASPSASSDARTRAGVAANTATPAAPLSTQEPPVIATRVLRGDPDRNREATKDGRTVAARQAVSAGADARAAEVAESPTAAKAPLAKPTAEPTTASGPELEPDSRLGSAASDALHDH